MRIISTNSAPDAIGAYSQGVVAGNLLFTSGQIAIDPDTNKFIGGDISAQTKRVLENISAIVKSAGTSIDKIVLCNVYLKHLSDFAAFNEVYAKYFANDPPARVTVEVSELPKGALVEISAITEKTSA